MLASRGPSLEVAFRVADGLGVETPELLGFQGLTGEGIEVRRIVSTLMPKVRRGVFELPCAVAPQKGNAR